MLPGVDRAAFVVALATRLRSRGVPVDLTALDDLVRALAGSGLGSRSQLYWTCRITLVRRQSEIAAFDAVFDAVFGGAVFPADPHARRTSLGSGPDPLERPARAGGTSLHDGVGLPWVSLAPTVTGTADADGEHAIPQRLPSEVETLADVPFEQLSPGDLALLGEWVESAIDAWPNRRTRRFAIDHRGHRIAIRPTIACSRRTGWEPVELIRVSARDKPRRVVMLCDVSQSMQAQTSAYLHLMRALALRTDAEVFAFATRLTRLTPVLAHRSAAVAFDLATAKAVDRFGGTRIATNLQAFLASRHGGYARGAIVVIGSDGWDSDGAPQLAAAMARLRRRAHRVVWMNPRANAPRFEPLVATMAAALPYCDEFLPADNFRSLARVVSVIARSAEGSSSRASRGSTAGTGQR